MCVEFGPVVIACQHRSPQGWRGLEEAHASCQAQTNIPEEGGGGCEWPTAPRSPNGACPPHARAEDGWVGTTQLASRAGPKGTSRDMPGPPTGYLFHEARLRQGLAGSRPGKFRRTMCAFAGARHVTAQALPVVPRRAQPPGRDRSNSRISLAPDVRLGSSRRAGHRRCREFHRDGGRVSPSAARLRSRRGGNGRGVGSRASRPRAYATLRRLP